jgi:hypothetical protein
VKLPAHRAGPPGNVISFYIVPLYPAYPATAGQGTFRSRVEFLAPWKRFPSLFFRSPVFSRPSVFRRSPLFPGSPIPPRSPVSPAPTFRTFVIRYLRFPAVHTSPLIFSRSAFLFHHHLLPCHNWSLSFLRVYVIGMHQVNKKFKMIIEYLRDLGPLPHSSFSP